VTLHQTNGLEINYLTPEEIEAWGPDTQPPDSDGRRERLRQRLVEVGQWGSNQVAGRRWPIGCVSLEITQRCNLDCTLCYLSEHSEAVQDISLEEIFRRIDLIHRHYGKDTDVQVSGGDPTLRKRAELVSIVRRITELSMRASLFTNGILATRDLLEDLCAVGLSDVAFHVDMTQQRKGYRSEADLNSVREKYISRARGLPLAVFFNTTIYARNFAEIPQLVRFFRAHTDIVSLISFQLQADTGRGILRERAPIIHQQSVIEKIQEGAGIPLSFDTLAAGHPRCNRYAMALRLTVTSMTSTMIRASSCRFSKPPPTSRSSVPSARPQFAPPSPPLQKRRHCGGKAHAGWARRSGRRAATCGRRGDTLTNSPS